MTDILKIYKSNWVNLSQVLCIDIKTDTEGNYPPGCIYKLEIEYIGGKTDVFRINDEILESVCRQLELHTVEPTVEWKEREPSPAFLFDEAYELWKDDE